MADPSWPAGQWQDHDYRHHLAKKLFHQLSTANMDESKLVESMLQLPPQYREQGSFELGGTSASTGPIICPNSSQGEIESHDSPGLFQLSNPAFGTNDEVFWPQPELAVPGSSQLLQPSESFPASQAMQDHFVSLTSDLGQATPSGSGVQAQPVYPPAFSLIDPTYPRARPVPSQPNPLFQNQMHMGSSDFRLPTGPPLLPSVFRESEDGFNLQRQGISDALPMHSGPNRGYGTSIMQSLQYQASAGGNHSNAVTSPEPQPSQDNHSILHAQSQRQFSLGSFGSTLPSAVDNDGMEVLQRQAGSDGLPMHGGPSRGYDTSSIEQSIRYQASAGQNHPGAVTNPELQPSQGNRSIPHAQSQRQLSLGSFGSTLPLPVNNDATKVLQRTGVQRHSSKQRTSSNAAPRNVPRARKSKAVTPNPFVIVSHALLVQVYDESHRKMISLTFEEGLFPTAKELTKRATKALDEAVALYADEGIKDWRSTDGEARITKLKAVVTMLHRDFADRIGNVITGFQLTFNITKSKAEMDLQRYTVVTTMLLDNSFLDGHLEIPVNASESRMCGIPFAHPTIVDFMEEMLSRQQYSRFIPFHEDVQWKKCIRNITCFIAALCRSKMRHAAGIDTLTRFPSQQDKDWYAAAIKDIRSFTGDKEIAFNYFIQAMPRMLGLSKAEEVARNSVE